MGSQCCKSKAEAVRQATQHIDMLPQEPTKQDSPPDPLEVEVARSRRMLKEEPQRFFLNYTLMSVQFFTNFEESLGALRGEMMTEKQMDGKKEFFADTILDVVAQNVVYQPRHGPFKNKQQTLHHSRTFLTWENIEIVHTQQSGHPRTKPYYKLLLDDCESPHLSKSGYVNLKEFESYEEEVIYERIGGGDETPLSNPTPSNKLLDDDSENTDDDEDDQDMKEFVEKIRAAPRALTKTEERLVNFKSRLSVQPQTSFDVAPLTTRTLTVPTDSNYGYSTIQTLTRAKLLDEGRMGNIPQSHKVIPKMCFVTIEEPLIRDRRRVAFVEGQRKLFMTYNLLQSEAFMGNFCDVFAETLAETLGFDNESVSKATMQAYYIDCPKDGVVHRIIPCVESKEWPSCGADFTRPAAGEVPWPTTPMVESILRLGCSILPMGHLAKRGGSPHFSNQWRLDCPKATKYLTFHLMHAHLRGYLFLLAIFKSYLEVHDNYLGLHPEQFLHLLFWDVHKDYLAWPEDKPWDTLLRVLRSLDSALDKRTLSDFFIRKRNLLESTPDPFINRAKGKLSQVMEHPLPHVLLALKNLRFKSNFYPQLDINKLYQILTTKDIIQHINPRLNNPQAPSNWILGNKNLSDDEQDEEDEEDEEKEWHEDMRRQIESEKAAKEIVLARAVSTDTICLTEEPKVDDMRNFEALKLLFQHFFAMAEKSKDQGAETQARLYLLHAKVLVRLITDTSHASHNMTEVRDFDRSCNQLEAQWETKSKRHTRLSKQPSIQERALPQPPPEDDTSQTEEDTNM